MNFSIKAALTERGYNVDSFKDGVTEALRLAVGNIAASAQGEWIRLAQARLNTTKDIYVNGLQQGQSFKVKLGTEIDTYEIQLIGEMPNNLEFGMASFDMKSVRPGWLGGGKAKTAKDGHKYIIIPFSHSTTGGRGAYTGKAAAVSAPDLKTQLKTTMKTYGLDRMVRTATGKVVEGPVSRVPKNAPVHPYLKGLTRIQKGTSGTTAGGMQRGSSTLKTWRVMSENSPASSWIHPGLQSLNLLAEVETYVDKELDAIIRDILAAA